MLRENEKLLVTSNFSFSHNVFFSYISLVRQNMTLCGNGLNQLDLSTMVRKTLCKMEKMLVTYIFSFSHSDYKACLRQLLNPFPNNPHFLHVCSKSLLKTLCKKEKLIFYENFLPFSSNVNCRLHRLSALKSLKCVIWERVNSFLNPLPDDKF